MDACWQKLSERANARIDTWLSVGHFLHRLSRIARRTRLHWRSAAHPLSPPRSARGPRHPRRRLHRGGAPVAQQRHRVRARARTDRADNGCCGSHRVHAPGGPRRGQPHAPSARDPCRPDPCRSARHPQGRGRGIIVNKHSSDVESPPPPPSLPPARACISLHAEGISRSIVF